MMPSAAHMPVPMSTIDVPTRAGSAPGWPLTDMRPP